MNAGGVQKKKKKNCVVLRKEILSNVQEETEIGLLVHLWQCPIQLGYRQVVFEQKLTDCDIVTFLNGHGRAESVMIGTNHGDPRHGDPNRAARRRAGRRARHGAPRLGGVLLRRSGSWPLDRRPARRA